MRKFTNINGIEGLLDLLPQNTTIITYEELSETILNGTSPDYVISPLNMDELYFFYNTSLKSEYPVYPLTDSNLNSKFIRNLLFTPYTPITIYIPQICLESKKTYDFQSYFTERNVERIIIKDEYGFHSGENLEYRILPVDKLNEQLPEIMKQASRIDDVGGIIIEAFEAGKDNQIFKSHIFGGLIPNEILRYDVKLSGLEGIFKSHKSQTPQLLESVETSLGSIPENIIEFLNPKLERYMPYTFGSIDFLISDDIPKIIDVNSKAGSLGQIQEMLQNNSHNPFKFFLDRINEYDKSQWQKQEKYLSKLRELSKWRAMIENPIGCDTDKLINLENFEQVKFNW